MSADRRGFSDYSEPGLTTPAHRQKSMSRHHLISQICRIADAVENPVPGRPPVQDDKRDLLADPP